MNQDIERWKMRLFPGMLSAALFFAAGALEAQAPAPAPTPPPTWSGDGSVSFVQTTGNSQNRSLGAGFNLVYQTAPWKAAFRAAFIETKADDVETSRRFDTALRGERAFGERIAAYGQVSYLRDLFAGIEGREIGEAGGVYKFLTGPQHLLSASAGLAYTKEQRVAPAEDLSFTGATAGVSYRWKLSPTAEFAEDLNYLYDFKDSSDWRAGAMTSLTASVTKILSVKLSHQLSYLHVPVPGKKRTDTILLASLVAKF
jgi:putative salt-induced outer membrane protein